MNNLIALLLLSIIVIEVYVAFKLRARFLYLDSRLERLETRINSKVEQLSNLMQSQFLDIQNTISLNSLGLNFPVFFGNWSIDGHMARFIVEQLLDQRPKTIVELGSGSSTILIARCLQVMGENNVTHVAVDHDTKYLELTRRNAQINGVEDRITFLECPLQRYEKLDKLWYGDLEKKLAGKEIDFLIVDAPPAHLQSHSRYPALPLLNTLLAEHCTVVLDDASRKEELEIAQRWVKEFPDFKFELRPEGHGIAVLSR